MKRLLFVLMFVVVSNAWAFQTEASWYSVESCRREGTSGVMANGEVLRDDMLIAASWDYNFGQRLKVTNIANGKSVIIVVKDRGPAKRLYRKGRKLDLSKAAFSQIADLKRGLIQVEVKEVVE